MYKTLHKKQGSVTVQLRFARSSVTFCAKRDNKEKPLVKNNHFVSETEQGSLAHGWGMKIIEQIVEKYHGELTIRVDVQVSIKILLDVQ